MRNYDLDRRLEQLYALKAYAQVERKPVNTKTATGSSGPRTGVSTS